MEISEDILNRVAELQFIARRSVSTLLSGNYRSAFRGSGMQFKEFRRYEPGDDIRHMSWRVTARTGRPTLKVYEEDRELSVLLMVDVSGSSLSGAKKSRLDVYSELIAFLGLAAVQSKDNVGMLFFNDKPIYYLPPRDTRNHVLSGMVELLGQKLDTKKSDIRPALTYANNVLKTRAVVIIISDFVFDDFEDSLRSLAQRHETILVHSMDDLERGASLKGLYEVRDPESGDIFTLDGNDPQLRRFLSDRAVAEQHRIETISRNCKADYQYISLQDDYLQRLVHFFRGRGPSRL